MIRWINPWFDGLRHGLIDLWGRVGGVVLLEDLGQVLLVKRGVRFGMYASFSGMGGCLRARGPLA